jgi:hypothetical protein
VYPEFSRRKLHICLHHRAVEAARRRPPGLDTRSLSAIADHPGRRRKGRPLRVSFGYETEADGVFAGRERRQQCRRKHQSGKHVGESTCLRGSRAPTTIERGERTPRRARVCKPSTSRDSSQEIPRGDISPETPHACRLSRSALVITDTDDRLIARAAMSGLKSQPVSG